MTPINSIYTFDPNRIPIEFSAPVADVDLRRHPRMADRQPSAVALEGADPQPGRWPPVEAGAPEDDRRIYPGEGRALMAAAPTDIALDNDVDSL